MSSFYEEGVQREDSLHAGANGSTIVESALVSVVLLFLVLAIVQVAVYLHIRNVVGASVAEGARYAANADVEASYGADRARNLIEKGVGSQTAGHITCAGAYAANSTFTVVTVRCRGSIPVFFAPFARFLPIDQSARSVREGQ